MKFLIVIFLLVLVSLDALPSCKKTYYNYMQLALTWPEQFCSEHKCNYNWDKKWDKKSLYIHGMWPSSTDLSYLKCQIDNGYDKYCYRDYDFDLSKFSWSQKQDLKKYWPDLSNNDFWKYQWDKHGTCYLHIIKDEEKSTLSQQEIMKRYFMETILKVKELKLQLDPQKIKSKKQLADQLGLHQSQFYAICRRDDELDQIRICYDIYYQPGYQYITKCPQSNDRNICKYPMYIK